VFNGRWSVGGDIRRARGLGCYYLINLRVELKWK
jgi:hypothetical protein